MECTHVENMNSPTASSTESTRREDPVEHWELLKDNPKPNSPFLLSVIGGVSARILLLDLPLLVTFLLFAASRWLGHVQTRYLFPQYHAAKFDRERHLLDNTYYTRVCDSSDMSTKSGEDLFLDEKATPKEAYTHQLKHGFTMFRSILQPTTAENLREYVVSRNPHLTKEESIYVIQGNNRYSFGLGTEVPAVAAAMSELANHPQLKPALTEILGPDAALIEMTAITSSYGALPQWWHDDVVSTGSPVQYGRAFGPSYSIFIQLQNTTRQMGATAACEMSKFCDRNGFQVVSETGYWNQGDALLMNMNSWHRGAAHTDPSGLDRVMLILTFVPKPETRTETRQLAQGITFSLRWDLWGFSLSDLAAADTAMAQPWTTLRSLGLYKKKGASWGIDYITSGTIRAANEDNGFTENDLDVFLAAGGFPFLPRFLQQFTILWDDGDSWVQYFDGTQSKCEIFFGATSLLFVALYTLCFALKRRCDAETSLRNAFLRIATLATLVISLYRWGIVHVDSTGWAQDIRANRRYTSTSSIEKDYFLSSSLPWGQSTLPTKRDVLIETRFGSRHLAMYNDFVPLGHPGNVDFNAVVKASSGNYKNYSSNIQMALIEFVAEQVAAKLGRFLLQGPDGFWMWMVYTPIFFIHEELARTPLLHETLRTLRFIESDYKYGVLRESAMAIKHSVPRLQRLRLKIVPQLERTKKVNKHTPARLLRKNGLQLKRSSSAPLTPRSPLFTNPHFKYHEPYPNAWLQAGEEIEAFEDDYWYHGIIYFVTTQGQFVVQYEDGSQETVDRYSVRRFEQQFMPGEKLECYVSFSDDHRGCQIIGMHADGSYLVDMEGEGQILVRKSDFRRPGQRISKEYISQGGGYHY